MALLAAGAAHPLAVAHARDAPEIFAPASAWAMDYADDSCRLLRTFSNGTGQVTISLERFSPGPTLVVSLTSNGLQAQPRARSAFLQYDDGSEAYETAFLYSPQADGQIYALFGSFPLLRDDEGFEELSSEDRRLRLGDPRPADGELAAASRISSLTIRRAFKRDLVIQLGSMADPIKAMHACTDELLEHWGVDAARHRTLSRRAFPAENPQQWLDRDAFPADEARKARQGINYVRVMVDAEGRPTACHVQRGSESDSFNAAACRILLQNAKFMPALDAAGVTMPSYYTTTFVWSIATGSRSGGLRLR